MVFYLSLAPVLVASDQERGRMQAMATAGERFDGITLQPAPLADIAGARVLAVTPDGYGCGTFALYTSWLPRGGLDARNGAGIDYVRGTLRDSRDPLPRIPPFRFRGGLRFQRNAFQAGADLNAVASQERISAFETPTDGYGLLKAYTSYSFPSGAALSTITARFDNATNALYRNHLSFLKSFAPEIGRGVRFSYSLQVF